MGCESCDSEGKVKKKKCSFRLPVKEWSRVDCEACEILYGETPRAVIFPLGYLVHSEAKSDR